MKELINTCIKAAKKDAEWFSRQENKESEMFDFLERTTKICDTILDLNANHIDKIDKWITDLSK